MKKHDVFLHFFYLFSELSVFENKLFFVYMDFADNLALI